MPHRAYIGDKVPVPKTFASALVTNLAVTAITSMFTGPQLDEANCAIISAHGGEVHMRWDGNDPTGTTGVMLDDTGAAPHIVIYGEDNVLSSVINFPRSQRRIP